MAELLSPEICMYSILLHRVSNLMFTLKRANVNSLELSVHSEGMNACLDEVLKSAEHNL